MIFLFFPQIGLDVEKYFNRIEELRGNPVLKVHGLMMNFKLQLSIKIKYNDLFSAVVN